MPVCTKKILRILVKYVRKLHVTPHACKENTPVNMKEKYASVQAMKRGYRCVYVCVIINQISSRQLLVCVWYQSTPGRAVNARTVCVCVHAHVRLRVGISVCICVCPASSLSRQQLLECVCVYMYANTAERLRLHKAVILLLIMKYFVLKLYRIPIQLHHATFSVAHTSSCRTHTHARARARACAQLSTGDLVDDTHPYPCPRLIACTDTYFSFMLTGAFLLRACSVTCNLRTYFTSVRRIFLMETVVLQTAL